MREIPCDVKGHRLFEQIWRLPPSTKGKRMDPATISLIIGSLIKLVDLVDHIVDIQEVDASDPAFQEFIEKRNAVRRDLVRAAGELELGDAEPTNTNEG
jgi:hypothetical protein